GLIIPVVVTVYNDRSFTFITKTPPASILLKRAAGIAKGSGAPNKDKVGKVTLKQVEDIAKQKMPDLNAASIDAAVRSVRGTARSMGIDVVGYRRRPGGPLAGQRPALQMQSETLRLIRAAMSGGRRRNHEESREKHHESAAGGGSASVSVEGRRPAAAKSEIRQI